MCSNSNYRCNDLNVIRTLQLLEFEIPPDEYYNDEAEDFERKEYRASRSCKRQLLTISFFICIIQVSIVIAMIQIDGYASKIENPLIGPPA